MERILGITSLRGSLPLPPGICTTSTGVSVIRTPSYLV
jgi:hypothetical protein